MFPFVLFMYFPSISWGGIPQRDGERRRVEDKIRVAGLSHTAIGAIPISADLSDEATLLQNTDGLPRRVDGASAVRRYGFHGRPACLLLSRAAYQKTVDRELDRRQVITEKRVAEFEKPFS